MTGPDKNKVQTIKWTALQPIHLISLLTQVFNIGD